MWGGGGGCMCVGVCVCDCGRSNKSSINEDSDGKQELRIESVHKNTYNATKR